MIFSMYGSQNNRMKVSTKSHVTKSTKHEAITMVVYFHNNNEETNDYLNDCYFIKK